MEKYIKEDDFLARWISGELSTEELKKFENSKDYTVLKRINDASQTLKAPTFNNQALLNKLREQTSAKPQTSKTRVIKLIPNWAYAAAAVMIAFGVFYVMNMQSNFNTGFSEQLAVVLPDNSEVKLNANSHLNYKTLNWRSDRKLELEGEAFFDVEKGKTFKVITNEGVVEVLGTEFNVISRNTYFEVQCMEGKVRVTSNTLHKNVVLLPGEAVRIVNNNFEEWNFELNEPNWLVGESTFYNAPILQVLQALENQFEITFDTSNIDSNKRFTGAFTHKDLSLAIKTVSTPMNLSYSLDKEERIIRLSSKE
ncbi:FecR family protein [Seonamhaeicola maritimus]|uniref:FecR domain-containing protein n=1 Tax=Seonamhaeicola maritimus TaxID=2591822 RepID=A0A5C7GHD2_9FLAO|nr:FecR family protein [Seonamhaeicola maritimus]TXG37180.1 FecR domain-containing protein [Seonamhaeicola maritimus]